MVNTNETENGLFLYKYNGKQDKKVCIYNMAENIILHSIIKQIYYWRLNYCFISL